MSELRRHIMMQAQGGGVLPSEYQEVKWLQGDGRAYIVSPIKDAYQDKVHFKIKPQGGGAVLGRYAAGLLCYTSFLRCRGGSGGYNYLQLPADEDGFYDIEVDMVNNTAKINGTLVQLQSGVLNPEAYGGYVYLFSRFYNFVRDITPSYICGISSEKDGVTTYNLVPCYRKADNMAGMYDIVNNVFYPNAGSGSFIVGPDV